MPTTTSLTALALRELRLAERTPAGQVLLAALAEVRAAGETTGGLTALLVGIGNDPDRRRRWRVASRVLAVAARGGLRAAALLVLLGPELGVARRRLRSAGLDVDLAESELVEALVVAIEAVPSGLPDGSDAAWVVRRIDVAARRAARAWSREVGRCVPLEELDEPAVVEHDPALLVSTLLAEAAAAGVLSAHQAELVHVVRVADDTSSHVARTRRCSSGAVRTELHRAEMALRAYLASSDVEPVR